jgi:anthranilate synthase component 1
MLMDLGRNDIGRVADTGSVKVTENMQIENYSHVMHIVSNVDGKLKSGLSAIDVLRATFPAGTVSGAPKVRAMEIIDELERSKRGVYAGAVGYLGFNGDMDLAIAIRTGVIKGGKLYVQAGAGIVADSVPRNEWIETENKAKALLKAAEIAELGLDNKLEEI